MTNEVKKLIIALLTLIALGAFLVVVIMVDVNLKIIKIGSIKEIRNKYDEVLEAESKLSKKESEYQAAVSKVNTSKTEFDTSKSKYEAISDETINIIKEATTEENYNIEYMWIRLGNYAKKNNLTIVMAEPGGSFSTSSTAEKADLSKTTNSTSSGQSSAKSKSDESNSTTNPNTVSENATNINTNTNESTNAKASTGTNQTNATSNESTSQSALFKIQVSGSYLDVSDFVFEVENDKALRFKLDNISMDYVSGTTIKATFNVKNLIINK